MRLVRGKRAGNRFTRSGGAFGLIAFLLLFAAWNTGNNLFYLVLGGVLSFMFISVILMFWDMRRLVMQREVPAAVYRMEPFLAGVRVENHKRFLPAMGLGISRQDSPKKLLGAITKIPARGAALLNIPMTMEKRGVHPLPPFILHTSFPFGLMERRKRYQDNLEILVYPRVSPLRTAVVEQMPGPSAAARTITADGDEFFSLREYLPGDELRRVAWRISARMGVWMVREMSLHHSRYVTFALDTRIVPDLPDFEERFEEAIELTASLAISLLKRHYHVGIAAPGAALEAGDGTHHERKILDMLAKVVPFRETMDFDAFLHSLEHQEARLICISPDPRQWGNKAAFGALYTLNLNEVVHA